VLNLQAPEQQPRAPAIAQPDSNPPFTHCAGARNYAEQNSVSDFEGL
jgi:hypothetical protein